MTDIIRAQIQKCPFLQNYFQPDKEQNEPAGRSSSQAAPVSVQTVTAIETKYQEQFTAFVDFLGFGEASTELDEERRIKVLELLQALASLRSEFSAVTTDQPDGAKGHIIKPTISTFSDHILISYPLQSVVSQLGSERWAALLILSQINRLLQAVTAAALRIGFVIRGGATIGKLYHAKGVVFGEAMIEAFQLETRTAIYPRVVLSNKITQRQDWAAHQGPFILKDQDGIHNVDYIRSMLFHSAPPGDNWNASVKSWFESVIPIIEGNLRELEANGKLNELAKWPWFAKRFRASLERLPPGALNDLGVSMEAILVVTAPDTQSFLRSLDLGKEACQWLRLPANELIAHLKMEPMCCCLPGSRRSQMTNPDRW
jgi:hypothetical protein